MKIKLAILEKDRSYLTRIVTAFGTKYADKFEIYSFTDADVAVSTLASARIDMLLASEAFDIQMDRLSARCAFAYLVDAADIETVNDQQAICKFQKADLIYKQILSIYSEKASAITGFSAHGEKGKILIFTSVGGGVGSSCVAAACAMHCAQGEKKALYLNLEKFGSADLLFSGQGQFDLSDIIYALKSKKTNLSLKLEGCVKQDTSGVFFYSPAKIALDRMELNTEEIIRLLNELKVMGNYDYIIVDMDFGIDKDSMQIFRQAQNVVLVGNGTPESNLKTERAWQAMVTLEQNADAPLTNRVCFVYNQVSSKNGQSIQAEGLKVLGGAPIISNANTRQIMEQLAATDMFAQIL